MSNKPTDEDGKDQLLLQALRETPSASLKKGVQQVDRLSPEEEDGHGRWLKSQKKKLINKLYSWFMHFLFFIICILVIVLVVAGVYLTGRWIQTFIGDASKLESFVYGIWNTGLVALATLFISSVIPKD